MLDPNVRQIYLEALRPPPGFRLDRAIATTYSLDLLALLVAPVSFALFDCESWEEALKDPLALMDSLRRNAERITLFCQVGQIHVPAQHQYLFSELEPIVVQVRAPADGGVFHPKTWTLRYVDDDGAVHYRFLCLSRNLTFDRSWDLVFAVEGPLEPGRQPTLDPRPIGDFVAALPGLAADATVEPRVGRDVDLVQAEIRSADLQLPPNSPYDAPRTRFVPLGIDGHRSWPFPLQADRAMAVSPFLSDTALMRLSGSGTRHVLVSRPESVDALTETTRGRFEQILVMDDAAGADLDSVQSGDTAADADAEDGEVEGSTPARVARGEGASSGRADTAPARKPDGNDSLSGLHAKAFIVEQGDDARVWVGSANATAAALLHLGDAPTPGRNVEFLVELAGAATDIGIDAFLGGPKDDASSATSFRDLLVPWSLGSPPDETATPESSLDKLLQRFADVIVRGYPRLQARRTAEDTFDLVLAFDSELPGDIGITAARCWPVTLPESHARTLVGNGTWLDVRFEGLSTLGLCRFVAFDMAARDASLVRHHRFVLSLPMDGEPEDRSARIVQFVLADRSRFLRYLMLLLAAEDSPGDIAAFALRIGKSESAAAMENSLQGIPLLEELVRALARRPERIGHVKRVVDDLMQTEEGRALLPDGFEEVWRPIENRWLERGPA